MNYEAVADMLEAYRFKEHILEHMQFLIKINLHNLALITVLKQREAESRKELRSIYLMLVDEFTEVDITELFQSIYDPCRDLPSGKG